MLKRVQRIWKTLGPGFITGSSDDDPSGIATYSQAGAQYGFHTLWTAIITLPLMICVLEMCARLSIVTSRGLGSNLLRYYSKRSLYAVIIVFFPAIVFNISANIAGMGAVANLIFPQIPQFVFSTVFTLILIVALIQFSYKKIAAILKWLCLVLVVYFIVPFMVKQDWHAIAISTIKPQIEWSREYLYILVAILGTTISPYLFFWQSSMSLEHKNHRSYVPNINHQMKEMKLDINIGMWISNLVMFFIMLTTGSVLFHAGINHIETVKQAAEALQPLAGDKAELLFAIGVIGTGFLAIPVLGGSIAYFVSETFKWDRGIDKKWQEAKRFYAVMIGAIVLGFSFSFIDINPIRFLIYTAVVYGMICPFLIALILHMCNKKELMGDHTNSFLVNVVGGIALLLNAAAALSLIYLTFFNNHSSS